MLTDKIKQMQEEAIKKFEPVLLLLDKGDEYIRNSDYDTGLPSSRFLTEHKLNTLITQTAVQTLEAVVEMLEKRKYGQALLGTPETTERVMLAVDNTLDDLTTSIQAEVEKLSGNIK